MNDDAIAPVIAVMLILAIGVTFFAVYTTTYLPALKEQAEIEHISEVETGILKFSSDIDNAVYMRNTGKLSEQIPLGGGDILLNSLKSSGTVRIQDELQVLDQKYPYLIIRNGSGQEYKLYMVNYSYRPLGNFWVDQGYTWQYGYVNITKGTRTTPLQDYTMAESENKMENFVLAVISKPRFDGSNLMVDTVSFSKGDRNISSGNGIAQISLNATRSNPVQFANSTGFSFSVNRTSPLNTTVYNYIFDEMAPLFGNDHVTQELTDQDMILSVTPTNPVNITVNELQIKLETQ